MDKERLKKLRCSRGYFTAASFAEALGMKRANYSNRENGKAPFTIAEFVKVCELLEIPLDEGIKFLI